MNMHSAVSATTVVLLAQRRSKSTIAVIQNL